MEPNDLSVCEYKKNNIVKDLSKFGILETKDLYSLMENKVVYNGHCSCVTIETCHGCWIQSG